MEKANIEKIINTVMDFIKTDVNALLPDYEDSGDGTSVTLPEIKKIVHGAVDVSRMEAPVVCSITVGKQTEYEESATTERVFDTELTIVFLCADAPYSALVSRACRYASAFKEATAISPTFNGAFTGSGFGSLEIDYDAGAVGGQMTAGIVNLTVRADGL